MVYPGPFGYEHDLATLREFFGDDAEMIMRGVSVASTGLDASDALERVLETMDDHRLGREMTGLKADIARAMWPPTGDAIEDIEQGPTARLSRDVHTTLGVCPAGTQVRVLDRMDDGKIFIGLFDRNHTVFPVEESALHLDKPA